MAYLNAAYAAGQPKSQVESVVFSSSFLQMAVYDPANYLLTLVFKNGYESMRRFVFPVVWTEFKSHPSPGKFYHESLKNQYPAMVTKPVLKVSDLEKAKKRHRPNLTRSK